MCFRKNLLPPISPTSRGSSTKSTKAVFQYSIMLDMRTLPIFRAARQAVQQGAIGDPILISSQKSYKYGAKRPWFYRERKTYGGTISWVGIHALDYMEWVSGQKYTHVAAYEGNKAHSQSPGCEESNSSSRCRSFTGIGLQRLPY